jgi:hypothetical protein
MSYLWLAQSLAWFLFFLGLSQLLPDLRRFLPRGPESLDSSLLLLKDIKESLLCGDLPSSETWNRISLIPKPWGSLAHESLSELRENGLPVLPTLERMEGLIRDQIHAAAQAKARVAQAWGQAIVCGSFVPGVALALYGLLPGVAELGKIWWLWVSLALLLNLVGLLWLLSLCEKARWAGLPPMKRVWWPFVLCFGERVLALLRSGVPPDLAWARAMPQLARGASPLVASWGADFWAQASSCSRSSSAGLMEQWGQQVRDGLQKSLVEGRSCSERVESALSSLKQDWDARVERELGLLGSRALQPLFFCVAPAVLGLLAVGLIASVEF